MTQRTEIEQARANALKTVRAAVRLRKSIEADEELNRVLPEVEKAFNAAVARGELPDPVDIMRELERG